MQQLTDLITRVLDHGEVSMDRTGVGTKSIFGGHISFDISNMGMPLANFKETRYRVAFLEMLWFLRGEPNVKFLHDNDCHLWDAWADGQGNLGPIYGVQWRNWGGVDQIAQLIHTLKTNPKSRRMIVSAWNVHQVPLMGLPPCHRSFQCHVNSRGELTLQVDQRSWDLGLGAPFNIAQYALLAHMLARAAGLQATRLMFAYGDAHVYLNHEAALREAIDRPKLAAGAWVEFHTDNIDIDGYKPTDFVVQNYHSHPFVKLEVAV